MSSERQTEYGRSSYRLVREQLMLAKRKEQRWKRHQITCQLVYSSTCQLKKSTCLLVYSSTCQLIVFIVFSYRRLSDVMCADWHWKLVYRWISAHITLLAEHPPISGSFLFLYIAITHIKGKKLSFVVQVVLYWDSVRKRKSAESAKSACLR